MNKEQLTEQQKNWFAKLDDIAFGIDLQPRAIRVNLIDFVDILEMFEGRLEAITEKSIFTKGHFANLYEHAEYTEATKKCEIWVKNYVPPGDILIGRPEKYGQS